MLLDQAHAPRVSTVRRELHTPRDAHQVNIALRLDSLRLKGIALLVTIALRTPPQALQWTVYKEINVQEVTTAHLVPSPL